MTFARMSHSSLCYRVSFCSCRPYVVVFVVDEESLRLGCLIVTFVAISVV